MLNAGAIGLRWWQSLWVETIEDADLMNTEQYSTKDLFWMLKRGYVPAVTTMGNCPICRKHPGRGGNPCVACLQSALLSRGVDGRKLAELVTLLDLACSMTAEMEEVYVDMVREWCRP